MASPFPATLQLPSQTVFRSEPFGTGYEIRRVKSATTIMPGATTRPRRRSSLTAVIFLITVGLGAKVGDAVDGTGTSKEEVQQVSPSQRYFDAVAPEGESGTANTCNTW